MSYFVYILRTSSNTLYIGQTNNLSRRLKEHNSKGSKSAKYVRYFGSFELVHQENFVSRTAAMRREAQLKIWSRAKKEALIDRKVLDRLASQ
jgi:putative endonuclease